MRLIVGLGNPGPQYLNTRHNFGFLTLDFFHDSRLEFSAWQNSEKFKALTSEGQIDENKIILAKPQTLMNNSGQAVKLLADFYKIDAPDILVLHDDLDLPLGAIRVSQNTSAGGHKGMQSIIDALGAKNFPRLRLGIKLNKQTFLAKFFKRFTPSEKLVLQKFSEEERALVQQATQKTKEAILLILSDSLPAAQNKFN